MIQILPVFDTINTGTWVDSYPYGAISVFALHPMYLNIESVSGVTMDVVEEVAAKRALLNKSAI